MTEGQEEARELSASNYGRDEWWVLLEPVSRRTRLVSMSAGLGSAEYPVRASCEAKKSPVSKVWKLAGCGVSFLARVGNRLAGLKARFPTHHLLL